MKKIVSVSICNEGLLRMDRVLIPKKNKENTMWVVDKNNFVGIVKTAKEKYRVVLFGLKSIPDSDYQRWIRIFTGKLESSRDECNYLASCWATYLDTIFIKEPMIPTRKIKTGNWKPALELDIEQLATLSLMKENS